MGLEALITKYSTPGPRYTSYPTAPQWAESVGEMAYREALARVAPSDSLALYVHLPFCEKLCYYCGCNIQITHDKERSRPYVQQVLRELALLADLLPGRRRLSQISWGGGTPTFLTLAEIEALHRTTADLFTIDGEAEVSLEVDPRVTSFEQLALLRSLGFNRVSLGVQDFNPQVQEAINRVQTAESTSALLAECRRLGFDGINYDLIYGLPFQTVRSFDATIDTVIAQRPDRIALYNYARLPSLLKHQTILEKFPMPEAAERVLIFTRALSKLTQAGYITIGMDHFALREDELAKSLEKSTLYRNFMGYTVKQGMHMLGVGASAIGEVGGGFFQNIKKPAEYEAALGEGKLATLRGLVLSDDDKRRKWVIQSILCRFEVSGAAFSRDFSQSLGAVFPLELKALEAFRDDGILIGEGEEWRVTERGRLFVRNVAMVFDAYLHKATATYSRTV